MNDFLSRARAKAQRLDHKSKNALDLVIRTIEKLKASNEQIAIEKARIDDYQAALGIQSQELTELQTKNTRIIENFSRLIEG